MKNRLDSDLDNSIVKGFTQKLLNPKRPIAAT